MGTIPEDFTTQSSKSNYTRLTPGKHRLRILGGAISGWEWWTDTPEGGRQPNRIKETEIPPVEFAEDVRKFLAMPVWNYEQDRIQILEITQSTIQKELMALDRDKDWGDLTKYDIEIERIGTEKNSTKYRVTPKPRAEISADIKKAVEAGLPVLEALYVNADPFTYIKPEDEEKVEEDLPF